MSESPYDIRVAVRSEYVPDQSEPDDNRYVFAYHVTIENTGSEPARLVSRHWVITDGSGRVQEVRGDGVVGEQPHLAPGERFEYTSAAVIESPVGAMQGSYQMIADSGVEFDAPIATFRLSVPNVLH